LVPRLLPAVDMRNRWRWLLLGVIVLLAIAEYGGLSSAIGARMTSLANQPEVSAAFQHPESGRTDALKPKPWPSDLEAAAKALGELKPTGQSPVLWLSDGLRSKGTNAFLDLLQRFGTVQVLRDGGGGNCPGCGAGMFCTGGAALATLAGGGAGGSPAAGGLAALVASSSAMMRRIEARISSIEGSWTFAAWLIPEFPTATI